MKPSRPRLALDDPLTGQAAEPATAGATDTNPYDGAASRQFNIRLLVPLYQRYRRLVRALQDEGFETTLTELTHALLDEGPRDVDETRALIRRWRKTRDGGRGAS